MYIFGIDMSGNSMRDIKSISMCGNDYCGIDDDVESDDADDNGEGGVVYASYVTLMIVP
jgi:hypothetical protein